MSLLGHFLLYNLLPSILIGLFAWLVVVVALKYLPIHDPKLRLSFLSVPVVKSALVLLGMSAFLPWSQSLFSNWQANALSLEQLLPGLFIWAGVLFLVYFYLVRQVRRYLLRDAYVKEELALRLDRSLQRVLNRYHQNPVPRCDTAFWTFAEKAPKPKLLVSDRLHSPTALVEGGEPIIVFPTGLVNELADAELDGVMAHELGHFVLRRNRWCTTTLLRRLIVISPAAAFVLAHLNREEELACDDIAVEVVGREDVYAESLVKSYRFAKAQSDPVTKLVRPLPQLLGVKAQLSTRIERVMQKPRSNMDSQYQHIMACCLWFGLVLLFFSGI